MVERRHPMPIQPTPEFSRPIAVDSLKHSGKTYEIEASEEERRRLAERFQVVSVESLSASIQVTPQQSGVMVRVHGTLEAKVTQACVVTLKPVSSHLNTPMERLFGPGGEDDDPAEEEIDLEYDPPEAIIDGVIDLGEIAAEELALDLDPFPRAPDAEFDGFTLGGSEAASEERPNPFAVLAQLRQKPDRKPE